MLDRVMKLKELIQENSKDRFARYGLGMEYAKQNKLEAAVVEFRELLAMDPDYVPAYLQAGQTLEKLKRSEEARAVYIQGIEAATRRGDIRAKGELETALSFLA